MYHRYSRRRRRAAARGRIFQEYSGSPWGDVGAAVGAAVSNPLDAVGDMVEAPPTYVHMYGWCVQTSDRRVYRERRVEVVRIGGAGAGGGLNYEMTFGLVEFLRNMCVS